MSNKINVKKAHQSGNVLFLILIAVALFAALSFVITQSSRSGSGDAAREKARMSASDILNQVTNVQTAVSRLILGGCAPEVINFESVYDAVNVNPDAPVDGHCDVFGNTGGGAMARQAPEGAATPDLTFYYVGSSALSGSGLTCTGTDCSDLTMTLYGVSEQVCEQLNDLNGISTAAGSMIDTQAACPFKGTFDCNGNGVAEVIFAAPELKGKSSVCWTDTVKGRTFSHVIMIR